jgi:tripartite-type tricarboxylate transporter receptor subunit TctC
MRTRTLAFVALTLVTSAAIAQTYPTRPIRFIVPYPPGGGTDTVARILQNGLTEQLGQQVVIDNRGGANAIIGTDLAAKSPPDGYTMLFVLQASMAVNPTLYQNLPYGPLKDFAPVIHLTEVTLMLAVATSQPIKTVSDLIQQAKANPKSVTYSSSGHGSAAHLASAMLQVATGTEMVHVPFKGGGPALTAVVSSEVTFSIGTVASELPHIKSGRLRGIAVAGAKRLPTMPDVPTISETVPGVEMSVWHGVVVPAGTSPAIVKRLNAAFNAVLKQADVQRRLEASGAMAVGSTPDEFGTMLRREQALYAKLLRDIGLAGKSKL